MMRAMLLLLVAVSVQARPLKVRVKVPGTLAATVGEKKKYATQEMVVKGALNGDDLRFLREMAGSDINQQPTPGRLCKIDMKEATFSHGGGAYINKEGLHYVTGGGRTLPPFLFRNCRVESVDLPARLDSIQTGALEYTKLRRIVLPDSVWVGPYAFYNDTDLEDVVFPKHVKGIGAYAFSQGGLKQIVMHNVDNIYGAAFDGLPLVETIEITGYLGHIDGWNMFARCPNLSTIDLRGPVVSTGGPRMIAECPLLERVTFHGAVLSTAVGAAEGCPAFKGYELKGTVLFSSFPEVIPGLSRQDCNNRTDDYKEAMRQLMPVLKQGVRNGEMAYYGIGRYAPYAYDEACGSALAGQKDEALDWLEVAVAMGWNDSRHMMRDEDLVSLHADGRFDRIVERAREKGDFLRILKKSAPYRANVTEWPAFTYQATADSDLVRVRKYFNLDSIAGAGDDVSRMKNLMYWLHDAIRHDGGSSWPDCNYNAIELYELCRREGRGLNCRFLAMMLNELYLACGIPSRYLTCQSKGYVEDPDCHVINVAWSRNLNKWVWMDPSFAAFVTDENGVPLHPGEVRERLIQDRPLILNEDANWNHEVVQTADHYLKSYMAKNLYWITACQHSVYQSESKSGCRSRMICLVPDGFLSFDGTTSDDAYFWQAPQ
ncbi:MAG: leucine-rich repeat protein [Clostridium sp.]|nr:leucine-rich repeat protein [Clostridium sp.]